MGCLDKMPVDIPSDLGHALDGKHLREGTWEASSSARNVGTGGALRHVHPQDFAMNKEVLFSFSGIAPLD